MPGEDEGVVVVVRKVVRVVEVVISGEEWVSCACKTAMLPDSRANSKDSFILRAVESVMLWSIMLFSQNRDVVCFVALTNCLPK